MLIITFIVKMEFINILMDKNKLTIVFTSEFFDEYKIKKNIDTNTDRNTLIRLSNTLDFRSDPIVHDIIKDLHNRKIPPYKYAYDMYLGVESKLVLYKIPIILKQYINLKFVCLPYDCEDFNEYINIDEKCIYRDLCELIISTGDIDSYKEKKKQIDDALCEYKKIKYNFIDI